MRQRVTQLLGCSLAHGSTESQYMGPLGKQTWQIAGFEDKVAFIEVKAIAADHLIDLIKNDNSSRHRRHLQEVFQRHIQDTPIVDPRGPISAFAPENQETIQADYHHPFVLEG